jgi:hypothetical protein
MNAQVLFASCPTQSNKKRHSLVAPGRIRNINMCVSESMQNFPKDAKSAGARQRLYASDSILIQRHAIIAVDKS